MPIRFTISHTAANSHARAGVVETPHGSFATPAFMPVGTRASIKGLPPAMVRETGSEIILNNAYHLMLRPGSALIARRGGVHRFMQWDGPILTDSGGYQAFSMSDINRIDDDGVTFKSIIDGSAVHLSPERSIEVQNELGADIIMAFDDCPPGCERGDAREDTEERETASVDRGCNAKERDTSPVDLERLRIANERTARWLERCVKAHSRRNEQALFGIVQGGTSHELRKQSIEQVCSIDLPGYAIGGVAVGEGPAAIRDIVEFTAPRLPRDTPRYLMGVGYERDLVMAVRAGCDMFDCVLPTRNGRNGGAFTRNGPMQLRNARFAEDDGPIDATCDCPACGGAGDGDGGAATRGGHFSRAYLRHLFVSGEMLGPILLSVHNIRHFQRLMLDIRRAVRENDWSALAADWPVLRDDAEVLSHP